MFFNFVELKLQEITVEQALCYMYLSHLAHVASVSHVKSQDQCL